MDLELEKEINEAVEYLKGVSNDKLDFRLMDPIAKMMLVSLLHESQKIKDYINSVDEKIVERFCEDFIPRREVAAIPALTIIEPKHRQKKDLEPIYIGENAVFTYKLDDNKRIINYIPIFKTLCVPMQNMYVLTNGKLYDGDRAIDVSTDKLNSVWVGISTKAEIESLKHLSLFISGTDGVLPEHIYVGMNAFELEFSNMMKMEDIDFVPPFDSQQSSSQFFSIIDTWKECLMNMNNKSLLYITDSVSDRDVFRAHAYPKVFEKWLEEDTLKSFADNTIWLRLDFPSDYIVPETTTVKINVLPVVNVDVNSVTLTQSSPIAKLEKQDSSFFLQILETSNAMTKQGFNHLMDDVVVRDFDSTCYHKGALYRDVRNIYNHFIDDYYAFIEYNGIKDGETITQLRDIINKIGKSVGTYSSKYSYDSGTYVMKNINQCQSTTPVKVLYATTLGKIGNIPVVGAKLENKKLPSIEKDVNIIVNALCGADKAGIDEKYENLRYYSLTNDRLYTKKDIEAFLRKEVIAEFGKCEYKHIFIRQNIEGAVGQAKLQRGLYITIEFKDKKNYDRANDSSFSHRIQQKIISRSCIAMPIIVNLKYLGV